MSQTDMSIRFDFTQKSISSQSIKVFGKKKYSFKSKKNEKIKVKTLIFIVECYEDNLINLILVFASKILRNFLKNIKLNKNSISDL